MFFKALSVGILAQVRIAYANLVEVKERFDLAEDLYEVYKKHETVAEIKSRTAGALSKIDLSRIKIETAQRAIERTQALGNYYLAYHRLVNAVGIKSFDASELEKLKKRIEETINNNIKDELEKETEYSEEIAEVQKEIDKYNEQITNYELRIAKLKNEKKTADASTAELRNGFDLGQGSQSDKYNNELENLKSSIAVNNNKIADLKTSKDKTMAEHAASGRTSKTDFSSRSAEFNRKITDQYAQISGFENKYNADKDNTLAAYEAKAADIKQALSSAEEKKAAVDLRLETVEGGYKEFLDSRNMNMMLGLRN
jgi:hypothetical protein